MSAPSDRRGFLRGLAGLPLVGNPVRAAAPLTDDELALYAAFALDECQEVLCHYQQAGVPIGGRIEAAKARYGYAMLGARDLHGRAAVVLSAAGVSIAGGARV